MFIDIKALFISYLKFSAFQLGAMEEHTLKIVNNSLNTNLYSYLETSVGQSYILYVDVNFLNASVN
jgi:hypothetical protein